MINERIERNIEGWIEGNNDTIRYKKHSIERLLREITTLQIEVDDLEERNKENQEALNKLRKE